MEAGLWIMPLDLPESWNEIHRIPQKAEIDHDDLPSIAGARVEILQSGKHYIV